LDNTKLHSIVLFVDDIERSANDFAKLLGGSLERNDSFILMEVGELAIGFHPSDEKTQAGSAVTYFATDDLSRAIARAKTLGFSVYRGPITVGNERIAQLIGSSDTRIGFVEKL
jgi:predicted enzyme related to lactoylglutathione lyase